MSFKEHIEQFKKDHFDGRSVRERHDTFLSFIKVLKQAKTDLTREEIELVKYMVRDQTQVDEVNYYYENLVEIWCKELFNVINTPLKKDISQDPEDDNYIDPLMMSLHDGHPDEWSKEDIQAEVKNGMKRYFEDE